MSNKNRTIVRIAGREYSLVSNDTDEYMQKVAIYVNRKMAETHKNNNKLSTMMIAVLASLNITDELLRCKDELQNQQEVLRKCNDELNTLKNELDKKKNETETIKKHNEEIKLELARKEAEIQTIRNDIMTNRDYN